jgi:hypothetical protein
LLCQAALHRLGSHVQLVQKFSQGRAAEGKEASAWLWKTVMIFCNMFMAYYMWAPTWGKREIYTRLLILQGTLPLLKNFTYIKIEVANFESYTGCGQLAETAAFLSQHGYVEVARHKFVSHPGIGDYFDLVYKKVVPA